MYIPTSIQGWKLCMIEPSDGLRMIGMSLVRCRGVSVFLLVNCV